MSSKKENVTLEIRPGVLLSREWAHAEDKDSERIYRFKFEPEYGYVRAKIGRSRDVHVRLTGDKRAEIFDLRILCDPFDQLNAERISPTAFVIHNKNTRIQVAYYAILVRRGKDIVVCDPMIGNDPKH